MVSFWVNVETFERVPTPLFVRLQGTCPEEVGS